MTKEEQRYFDEQAELDVLNDVINEEQVLEERYHKKWNGLSKKP